MASQAGLLHPPADADQRVGSFSALVIDDDDGFRESLGMLVAREGYVVREARGLAEARRCLGEGAPDVILIDLSLPDGDGIELIRDDTLRAGSEFVVVTGNASVESAVQALREGALDYLTKPLDRPRLKSILAGVARTRGFKTELAHLRAELRELGRFGRLVGRTAPMQKLYDLIERVAPTEAGVLLTGESGTGKELAAETIHALSRRRQGPFLAVNCAAVSKSLIESELFGHEKGSFTGAENRRRGYFEEAKGGTLFLDEVIEMPAEVQAKMLRVLETGTILRVGASEVVPVDVRVIAATNRDPVAAVRSGNLREDLYYRLNVFPISLPPLRERVEDIELLAEHFLAALNTRERTAKRLSAAATARLSAYSWPGNVRELKNALERAAILADQVVTPDLLPGDGVARMEPAGEGEAVLQVPIGSSVEEVERRLLVATLEHHRGDKQRTAQTLGMSLKTLYSRLKVYQAAGHTIPDSSSTRPPADVPSSGETGSQGSL
jgi:DNA-binding NtrC family response regulator